MRPAKLDSVSVFLTLAVLVSAEASASVAARVRPPVPISSDAIVLVVTGVWASTCVPRFVLGSGPPFQTPLVQVDGERVTARLDAVPEPGQSCTAATTRFSAEFEIGSLPFGDYVLEAVIYDEAEKPVLTVERAFNVLSETDVVRGIAVEPEQPLSTDNARLLVWGVWQDGCVPRAASVTQDGSRITVLARSTELTCTSASEVFAYSADLGALEEGRYDVTVLVDDGLDRWVYDQTSFTVLAGARSALLSERFRVSVGWSDFDGGNGFGSPIPVLSEDTAAFWFFDRDNWEMLVKTLDGCGVNGHYWVFASAVTDVAFTISVTDTVTSVTRTYENPLGNLASAITDVSAFPCS